MANIYVGPTSAGLADGTSWANRYGSLNAAEDRPIQAGDTVWVGPGVYRETLTCDVSGAAGSPITYAGDYTGANTDGVGGVVRITGSNDDRTAARASCIIASGRDYRTFSGFMLDTCTSHLLSIAAPGANCIIQRCYFTAPVPGAAAINAVNSAGTPDTALTVQSCVFLGGGNGVSFTNTNALVSTNLVQNCLFVGLAATSAGAARGVGINRVGGGTVKNCLFLGCAQAVQIGVALPGGYTAWAVNNCAIWGCATGFAATALGELIEDYNNVYGATTARSNVAVGANSLAYPPLFDSRWFFELVNAGRMLSPFDLASYSQLVNVAGTSPTATDMRGTAAIGGQREWGALEYDPSLLIRGGAGAVSISPFRGNIG